MFVIYAGGNFGFEMGVAEAGAVSGAGSADVRPFGFQ
jgi:hypothetical protein